MPFIHTKANYRMDEAGEILSLGKSELYSEIRLKRLHTNGEGRDRRISDAQIDAYILLREQEAGFVRIYSKDMTYCKN